MRRRAFCAIALFQFATACRHVSPWERGKLAHPSMVAGSLATPGEEHVYAVHQGATGGAGGAESGCGCN